MFLVFVFLFCVGFVSVLFALFLVLLLDCFGVGSCFVFVFVFVFFLCFFLFFLFFLFGFLEGLMGHLTWP